MFNLHKYIYGLFILSMIWVTIGHIYREQVQTVLKHPLMDVPSCVLDGWSIIHFATFFAFGFIEPNKHLLFTTLSVVFETFEDGMSSDANTQLIDCKKNKNSLLGKIHCNGYENSYWYGKWDDVFVNILGYIIGSSIRTSYFPTLIL
jgi:hypothetical protein